MAARCYRVESPTQTTADAERQQRTGEIWGKTARSGAWPKVKAYVGRLPDGDRGVEFETDVRPDSGCPPGHAYWSGPRPGVEVDGDYAKIKVRVTRNAQR